LLIPGPWAEKVGISMNYVAGDIITFVKMMECISRPGKRNKKQPLSII